ncbi:MAG TPA: hypothetical protein VJN43_22275 [Bryobacteraceae bacterium]|nr:hypothetical protein [Bryobacteraceae bacterium]
MDEISQIAVEVARRILRAEGADVDSPSCDRVLADLAEMIRQNICGEKLLEENTRWMHASGNTLYLPTHY